MTSLVNIVYSWLQKA